MLPMTKAGYYEIKIPAGVDREEVMNACVRHTLLGEDQFGSNQTATGLRIGVLRLGILLANKLPRYSLLMARCSPPDFFTSR